VNNNGARGVPAIRFGNGILVAGAGNLVEDNQADDNFASGVAISANANTINNNTASGNAIAPPHLRAHHLRPEGLPTGLRYQQVESQLLRDRRPGMHQALTPAPRQH
jgi:parallel beta-helix repeat protein